MKRLFLLLVLLLVVSVPAFSQTAEDPVHANYEMMLRWDPSDPVELVVGYKIYVASVPDPSSTNAVNKVVESQIAGISLVDLMRNEPNGVYEIYVTAVNNAGLESAPSPRIWFFWHWRPSPPKRLVIEVIPTN